jgi:hypothetical protein
VMEDDVPETHVSELTFPRVSSPSPVNVPSQCDVKPLLPKDPNPDPPIAQSKERILASEPPSTESKTLTTVVTAEIRNERVEEGHVRSASAVEPEAPILLVGEKEQEDNSHRTSEESSAARATDSIPPLQRESAHLTHSHTHTPKFREATAAPQEPPRRNLSIITHLETSHTAPTSRSVTLPLFPFPNPLL